MGEFQKQGWEIDVVTPVAHSPGGSRRAFRGVSGNVFRTQVGPTGEKIRRVPFLRHGTRHLWRFLDQCFSALWTIPAGMLAHKPDVVIVTAPSLPIMGAGYILARLRGVPLILEMRDAWPDLARDARLGRGGLRSGLEVYADFIQRRASLVVMVTEGFAEVLRSRGIGQVATISNWLHVNALPALPPPPLHREVLEVLYLGNHGESQSLETSIRASAIVGSRMHLHLVGK